VGLSEALADRNGCGKPRRCAKIPGSDEGLDFDPSEEHPMHVHWRTLNLDTPHWNALKYIEILLKTRRELPYDILQPAQDGDFQIIGQGKGGAAIVTTVVCVPVEDHKTWVTIVVSGEHDDQVKDERTSIGQEIVALHLN